MQKTKGKRSHCQYYWYFLGYQFVITRNPHAFQLLSIVIYGVISSVDVIICIVVLLTTTRTTKKEKKGRRQRDDNNNVNNNSNSY